MVHGNPASGAYFLIHPNKSMALMLSDGGFDVWVLHTRGASYSTINDQHEVHDKHFWDFSFHEHGYFDLPRAIDYIEELTGNKKLHFVGNSQGGTDFLVMLSTKPEYNKKIASAYLITPGAFLPLTPPAKAFIILTKILHALNINSVRYKKSFIQKFLISFCRVHLFNRLCYEAFNFYFGQGIDDINQVRIPCQTAISKNKALISFNLTVRLFLICTSIRIG